MSSSHNNTIPEIDLLNINAESKDDQIVRLEREQQRVLDALVEEQREFILSADDYDIIMERLRSEIDELEEETFDLEADLQREKFHQIKLECEEQEEISKLHADIKKLTELKDKELSKGDLQVLDTNQKIRSLEHFVSKTTIETRTNQELISDI